MILFSSEKKNKGRQTELDVARGLAIIFMVFVHVQMFFSTDELVNSLLGDTVDFLGGIPAAPVFMFLMGIGFLYTKKNDPIQFIKRGILILFSGYLLNFLRGSLPELINYFSDGNKEHLNLMKEHFIEIDILQFAGLSIIFFGILKLAKMNNWGIALLGLSFALLNFVILGIKVDRYFLQAVTGLFWGSSDFSSFPFLSWIFYPISGYLFATFLIRCVNKKLFYKLVLIGSLLLMVSFTFLFVDIFKLDIGMNSEMGYYHHNLSANIIYVLFCLFWISILFFSVQSLPQFLIIQFKRWSKNVTEIYFIHWVMIGWLGLILHEHSAGLILYIILTVSIFAVSDWISYLMDKKNINI